MRSSGRIQRASIALGRINTLDDLDIGRGHGDIVRAGNPVLGAGVAKASSRRRHIGDLVIGVCGTPLCIGVGDIRGQR